MAALVRVPKVMMVAAVKVMGGGYNIVGSSGGWAVSAREGVRLRGCLLERVST